MRKKPTKQSYDATWPGPTLANLANVTIKAVSNHSAITQARSVGSKLGFPNRIFTLRLGNRLIHHGL
jgi:hypothetical protein